MKINYENIEKNVRIYGFFDNYSFSITIERIRREDLYSFFRRSNNT